MPREIAGFDEISRCDQIAERIGFSLELELLARDTRQFTVYSLIRERL
jgi:hypothetical protein